MRQNKIRVDQSMCNSSLLHARTHARTQEKSYRKEPPHFQREALAPGGWETDAGAQSHRVHDIAETGVATGVLLLTRFACAR